MRCVGEDGNRAREVRHHRTLSNSFLLRTPGGHYELSQFVDALHSAKLVGMSAAVAAVVLRRRRKGPSKSTGAARKQKAASNRVQYSALVEADRLRFELERRDVLRPVTVLRLQPLLPRLGPTPMAQHHACRDRV